MESVTVTGCGLVTSLGVGVVRTWEGLLKATNAIKITASSSEAEPFLGARIVSQELPVIAVKGRSLLSFQNHLLMIAVCEACKQAGFDVASAEKLDNVAVYCGSGAINIDFKSFKQILGVIELGETGPSLKNLGSHLQFLSPVEGMKILPTASCHFGAQYFHLHGLGNPLYAGEISSLVALVEACHAIEYGEIDAAVVCSSNTPFSMQNYLSFQADGLLCEVEGGVMCPLDVESRGTVLGEGAACVVLERSEKPGLGKIRGGSFGLRPGRGTYAVEKEGFIKNYEHTLKVCDIDPKNLGLFFPSAPSVPLWDAAEMEAVCEVFKNTEHYAVASVKGSLGYLQAASSLVDVVVALACLRGQMSFPMPSLRSPRVTAPHLRYMTSQGPLDPFCSSTALVSGFGGGGFYGSVVVEIGEG